MSEPTLSDLKILLSLLQERHVSRAAEQLDMTQSAVSKALARLRRQFDDALLIRGPGGYGLSNRAREMLPRLQSLIGEVSALTRPTEDIPGGITSRFRISAADDVAMLLLPRLQQALVRQAPASDISMLSMGPGMYQQLAAGEIDLALEVMPPVGSSYHTRKLFDWSFCCVMSPDHPLANGNMTVEDYAAARHGLVSFGGDPKGMVDGALDRLGLKRRVNVVVPQFSAAPMLIEQGDIIFAMPEPLARHLSRHFSLAIRPLPLDVSSLNIGMIWHHRSQHDPAQRWLRQTIAAIATEDQAQ